MINPSFWYFVNKLFGLIICIGVEPNKIGYTVIFGFIFVTKYQNLVLTCSFPFQSFGDLTGQPTAIT